MRTCPGDLGALHRVTSHSNTLLGNGQKTPWNPDARKNSAWAEKTLILRLLPSYKVEVYCLWKMVRNTENLTRETQVYRTFQVWECSRWYETLHYISVPPKSMYINQAFNFVHSNVLTSWSLANPGGTHPFRVSRDSKNVPVSTPFVYKSRSYIPTTSFMECGSYSGALSIYSDCSRPGTRQVRTALWTKACLNYSN